MIVKTKVANIATFLSVIAFSIELSSSLPSDEQHPRTVSFDLSPTAQLSVPSNSHRNLKEWKYRHAIYGALEHFESEEHSLKEDFDKAREFSRYEWHKRHLQAEIGVGNKNTDGNSKRQLSTNDSSYQLTPLFQGYGTHYASVWVGTPPQRKSVIVDTGSHYTAFPCVGCKNCGEEHHTDPYFDPSKSSTFHTVGCNECESATCGNEGKCVFSQSYTEGSSWSAFQAVDNFFCGSSNLPDDPVDNSFAIRFMFGCQTSETGLFVTQLADGIMGMSAHVATLPKKMVEAKKLEHNLFTLCFKRELSVSKEGVTAGILTLGGVDTRLNSSPMVYAKNMADSGWYTVNVKNIFLRKGGGVSAKLKKKNDEIIHIPMNAKSVNSGKGVIVDSGTTDTYLSRTLQKAFYQAWKAMTGMNYSNSALKISLEEIRKLPTLLIQLEAFDGMGNKELISMEQKGGSSVVGLVGSLDVTSPRDVLIAVPAESFFEYSPSRDTFTSRLYFTETRGGVLGANAMQGHDVLFDWENGRIGFAESSCNHSEISKNTESQPGNLIINDGEPPKINSRPDEGSNLNIDCILSPPNIITSCEDSATNNAEVCAGKDPESPLENAFEKSAFVVEKNSMGQGKSCEEVAHQMSNYSGSATCNAKGMCTLTRKCDLKCKNIIEKNNAAQPPISNGYHIDVSNCAENTPWGSCHASCKQSRMKSKRNADGSCSAPFEETRSCHIDSCGSHDPCRVPFVVHAVIGLNGVDQTLWSKRYEEIFVEVFARSLNGLGNIGPGDIEILMTSAWDPTRSDAQEVPVGTGIKLIMEISIYSNLDSIMHNEDNASTFKEISENTSSTLNCKEEDLYPYAKTALDLHSALRKSQFIPVLLDNLPSAVNDQEQTPFARARIPGFAEYSKIITSWTIKTDKGSVHTHLEDESNRISSSFSKEKMENYVTDVSFMAALVAAVFFLCGVGMYIGYRVEAQRDFAQANDKVIHSSSLMGKMRQRYRARPSRGKYSKIKGSKDYDHGDIELA